MPHIPQPTAHEAMTHTHTHTPHSLCRAGLRVAEMGAQCRPGVRNTHGGVDLNLLVLKTDGLGGDTTWNMVRTGEFVELLLLL